MADIAQLGIAIDSNPVASAATNLDKLDQAARRAESGTEKMARQINKDVDSINKQLGAASNMVRGFVTALASIQTVRALSQMADTWSDLTSRVRLAIGVHGNASAVMDRLAVIARQTYSSLELTAESFVRNATTLNALGKSTQQQLDYTQALNNALVVSGAKGEHAAMVQDNLAKAMATGGLRAQELETVLNRGSRVAQLLADELGVNVTQLREVAAQGKITGEVIFNSLVKNMEAVTKEAESMPATIGDAFTLIRNAFMQSVGVFDQANKISESFAEKLIWVADNMGKVLKAAVTLGAVLAGIWTTKLVAQAIMFTTQLIAQGVQYARNTTLAAAWAAAHAGGIAASIKSVGALNIALGTLAAGFAGWQIGKWLRDNFLEAELAGIALVDGVLTAWEWMKEKAQIIWAHMKNVAISAILAIRTALADMLDGYASVMQRDLFTGEIVDDAWAVDLANSIRPAIDAAFELNEEIRRIELASGEAKNGIHEITSAMADDAIAKHNAANATKALVEEEAKLQPILNNTTKITKEAAAARRMFAQIEEQLVGQAADLSAQLAGPGAVAQREYEKAVAAAREQLSEMEVAMRKAGDSSLDLTAAKEALGIVESSLARIRDKTLDDLERERDILGQINAEYSEQYKRLGLSRRELAGYEAGLQAVERAQKIWGSALDDMPGYLDKVAKEASDAAMRLYDIGEALDEFGDESDESPILKLVDGMKTLREEIEKLEDPMNEAFDPERAALFSRALDRMNTQLQIDTIGSYKALLGAAQAFTTEGSKGFQAMEAGMAALSIVQDVIALKAAVSAVLTQGQGDPYSAWARMAAMAAAVAPYIASIGLTLASFGGGGGGFSDTAGQRQATQGTGSVLGDAEAKSESILNATEITADATSALVGINRGMLNALLALQGGISNATVMLARGAGQADFSGMNLAVSPLLTGHFANRGILGRILGGGSSEITDQGLRIGGGSLSDINLSAYQEVQSRSWMFGSRHTRTGFQDVGEEFENQFQLIIDSIVDTVREGALALGLVPEEIEAAIAAFELAEINISLMDLSAEEQQAELEAVFSQIFDDLAGHVVPFIAQFQRVGEGLGETLVRVATSVQVMQEAIRYLGLAVDETDPERFAQISVALIDAVGGIEEFIQGMGSFMSAFAPDSHRLAVAQDELNRAFEQAGLTVPATRDEMWALMQSLDATTEEGREQIATLLRLAGVADEYYGLLEDGAEAMERATQAAQDLDRHLSSLARDGFSEPLRQIIALDDEYQEHVATIQRLARESGRAEASEGELAIARNWHTRQLRRLTQEILRSAAEIAAQLGYAGFEQFGDSANDPIYDAEMDGIGQVASAVEDRYARELQLLEQLDQYVRTLGTSALSPLTPTQRLGEAQAEYQRLLALAQGGDLDALAQLQGAANTYLAEAQSYYGGVGPYQQIFEQVRAALGGLVEAGPQSEQIGPQTPVFGGPVSVSPAPELIAQNEIQRALLAQQLVEHLAALSVALNTPILELIEQLNIPLTQLVEDLGINLSNISGAAVEALAQLAMDLGLPLGELVEAIGLDLPALADGIRELAEDLGYDLQDIVNATDTGLYNLAQYLGVDLQELAEALGQDLGALTDVNSPIYQALSQTIGTLPEEQANALSEYLEAIANSPDGESAAANIAAMEDHINTLPAGIRDQLAPFFENVDPVGSLTDLDYLRDIDLSLEDLIYTVIGGPTGTNHILNNILGSLQSGVAGGSAPGFASGGWVNGPSMIMAGEAGRELVLPNHVSEFLAQHGIPINSGAANDAVVVELRATRDALHEDLNRLRGEVYQLRKERAQADRDSLAVVGQGVQEQARAARASERAADRLEQLRHAG